jgi:vacuolar-type H+-ATPase subunit I/STV1
MTREPDNPYAAPQADALSRRTLFQALAAEAFWSWLLIFLINLPVPVMFGWEVCSPAGRQAMVVTLVLLFGCSAWFVGSHAWYRVRLICGGIMVAVSQLFPLLQIIAGSLGIWFVEKYGINPPRQPLDDGDVRFPKFDMNVPAAILLTLFVGGTLLLAALIIGTIFRLDSGNLPEEKAAKTAE